ncbi:FKBP-type peptidyl-prolyl cis-trans isomerase [Salinivirga cyanobacteriivorans]|uniref:Peptidyl-prolyl cis-trans isomerase n=1 Tax=Salinivirga cyanobacteriivorans TaxID=1307839 RepID=A0A0S2I4S1_9BACT|nr:peptidylprolyl isomerase [Salinivirga cyanobacteriivorans]ALO17195.1 FKBP-type peptidyl-prolyl cis-trans isomerase SlyD [Salinivirga cyanobacteriivorans]
MMIEKNKVVELTYELKDQTANGETIEKVTEERPLTFIFGAGLMIPKFESNIEGMNPGDDFEFELKSQEAYGSKSEEMIMDLPLNVFEVDGKVNYDIVKEGAMIPMMDKAGNRINGVVLEIGDEAVKMDFNHPMAGRDLHFKGNVLNVREATDEELAAIQHNHDEDCSSCNGNCSEC